MPQRFVQYVSSSVLITIPLVEQSRLTVISHGQGEETFRGEAAVFIVIARVVPTARQVPVRAIWHAGIVQVTNRVKTGTAIPQRW